MEKKRKRTAQCTLFVNVTYSFVTGKICLQKYFLFVDVDHLKWHAINKHFNTELRQTQYYDRLILILIRISHKVSFMSTP